MIDGCSVSEVLLLASSNLHSDRTWALPIRPTLLRSWSDPPPNLILEVDSSTGAILASGSHFVMNCTVHKNEKYLPLQFINATQAIPSANIGDMKALEVPMLRTALIAAIAATPALADPEDYGHMMGWGYGNGLGMIFGPVLWLLVLGLIVVGVIWFVRRLDHQSGHKATSNAMAELDLRFARGEIDADEYASRKKLLMS